MSIRTVLSKVFVLLLSVVLMAGFSANTEAATIKVGSLNDMTGATSDVGKDYALGIAEAIHYVNDNGGVNGKKIKLYQFDYGYRVPEARPDAVGRRASARVHRAGDSARPAHPDSG